MDRAKIGGIILCLLALLATVVILWGLVLQEWWAVAVPVAVLVVVCMTLLFWVGWTLFAAEVGPPPPPGSDLSGRQRL